MSQRKYAEHIGVSEGAVRKAILTGKFVEGYDSTTKKINPVEAQKNTWVKAQEVPRPKAGVSRAKVIEKTKVDKSPRPPKDKPEEPDYEAIEDFETDELIKRLKIYPGMPAHDAMRINEIIDAALNRKKLEEAEGILVRRDKVERALFVLGSELKKALFNMPQRIVRDIMAANTEVEALNVFNTELTQILETYGNLQFK